MQNEIQVEKLILKQRNVIVLRRQRGKKGIFVFSFIYVWKIWGKYLGY